MTFPKWATTVAPFSKTLALAIFITFPIIGFVFGMKYQQIITTSQKNIIIFPIPTTPSIRQISPTNTSSNVDLANPAAVYCKKQGGKNEIITASDGSQSGQCIFSDGRKCDDWQFFRTKTCK